MKIWKMKSKHDSWAEWKRKWERINRLQTLMGVKDCESLPNFQNPYVHVFCQIWAIFSHYVFKYFFRHTLFLFFVQDSSGDRNVKVFLL